MHLHHGVMLSLKTDIMKLAGKWIELGKIILSEAAQTQKYKKNDMHLFISGEKPLNKW